MKVITLLSAIMILLARSSCKSQEIGIRNALHSLPPPCDSQIFCHGPLLHTIQTFGMDGNDTALYHDSKSFVDKKLKFQPELVFNNFTQLMKNTNNSPSKTDLIEFINSNFESEGSEFEPWDPQDWIPNPRYLNKIKQSTLRRWNAELVESWRFLGRKIKDDVRDRPELYSIIYLPHPFIIPGGRFREIYYWDSYWIVNGLLLSQMNQTVRGMIENMIFLIENYGFVPNGGRIYYTLRSQPPMLISMVERYLNATEDTRFLSDNIHTLEKEILFWINNRTVDIKSHKGRSYRLARYNVEIDFPRPESYREDILAASTLNEVDRQEFYMNIKSGCETGWDFSSRWYIIDDQGASHGNLSHINTRYIVPVDLNAIICNNARLLSSMYRRLGDTTKADLYNKLFLGWKEAIKEILWDDESGVWFDYDFKNRIKRPSFYASNFSPMWAECWTPTNEKIDKILDYFEINTQTANFIGGIPTSLKHTGQQWDYPNGWPPLQHLVVAGLQNTGYPRAQKLALKIAQMWTANNFETYMQSMPNAMFEKYDVTVIGLPGGGGEYDVQLGFGWTNGVIMSFFDMYGDQLEIGNIGS